MTQDQQFNDLKKRLRAVKKTRRPIMVLRPKKVLWEGEEVCGTATDSLGGAYYIIRVSRDQPFEAQCETLAHEWAHVLDFDTRDWHDPSWGQWYSVCYNVWEAWVGA